MSGLFDTLLSQYIVTVMILLLIMWYVLQKVFKTPSLYDDEKHNMRRQGFSANVEYDNDLNTALVQHTVDKVKYTTFDMADIIQEGKPEELMKNPSNYPLQGGIYGDVQVYLYGPNDIAHYKEWNTAPAIYLPNSNLWWEDTNRPKEKAYW